MSELPKFSGHCCCTAGAVAAWPVDERLAVGVDGRAVGGVAGVVPDAGAVGAGRGRVDVVAEELRGQRVRAAAAWVAGAPRCSSVNAPVGRHRVDRCACRTTPTSARGSAVVVRNGVVNAL